MYMHLNQLIGVMRVFRLSVYKIYLDLEVLSTTILAHIPLTLKSMKAIY